MQEEVDSRTVALSISAAKFTGRLFKAAIGKYMAHRKEKKLQKARDGPVKPCGKQTVKQLIGQNQGVSTIESNAPEIKNFERIARKYGVDYAVKKVKADGRPKYVIFFKARDADALTQAFTEYSRKTATTFRDFASTATTEGSRSTIPRPRRYTNVFAVPRSIPMLFI